MHVSALCFCFLFVLYLGNVASRVIPKAASPPRRAAKSNKKKTVWRWLRWIVAGVLLFYAVILVSLLTLRWINPPTTAVQIERRFEAWSSKEDYQKRYIFVPLNRISPHFQHAVIAAEDTRFFQHHGFDWKEMGNAAADGFEKGRIRGASTITQQLVKNLFLTTSRSAFRKVVEFSLVPFAEFSLPKQRILELYLNIVEWGPGIYGAEAAARYHYGIAAARVNRDQGARLAAILPAPRKRKTAAMKEYSSRILERMRQMGW